MSNCRWCGKGTCICEESARIRTLLFLYKKLYGCIGGGDGEECITCKLLGEKHEDK